MPEDPRAKKLKEALSLSVVLGQLSSAMTLSEAITKIKEAREFPEEIFGAHATLDNMISFLEKESNKNQSLKDYLSEGGLIKA